MSTSGSVEEVHREYTKQKLEEILDELKMANQRMSKAETAIAVLQVGYLIGAGVIAALFLNLMRTLEAVGRGAR